MDLRSVDLISNCYRIYLKDHDLVQTLYQYEIEVKLSDASLSDHDGEEALPLFIKQMSEQQNIPVEVRQKIVSVAVDQWLEAEAENSEDRFVKCNLDCSKLIANLSLHGIKGDTKLLNVPYRHGNLRLSTLIFCVQLKETKFDYLTLANIATGVDGRTSPNLIEQSATSTTRYNIRDQIVPYGCTLLRGQIVRMKSLAFGPALSVCNTSSWFYEPLDKEQKLVEYALENFRLTWYGGEWRVQSVVPRLNQLIAGRQVEVSHIKLFDLPRRVQVGVLSGTARDGIGSETICSYFKRHYGIVIEHPNWPCVKSPPEQVEQHTIPMELCQLPPAEEVRASELVSTYKAELTRKLTELEPLQYFERIENHIKFVVESNETDLKKIGLSIDSQPIRVTGQLLTPVSLVGKNRSNGAVTIKQENGQYDTSAARFVRPVKLSKIRITLIGTTQDSMNEYDNLNEFINEYRRVGQSHGVETSSYMTPPIDIIVNKDKKLLKLALKRHVEQSNKQSFDHSIMVLTQDCAHLESYLQLLETRLNHPTGGGTRLSCLQLSNLKQSLLEAKNKNDTLLANLWLKYNSQLGGLNYVLNLKADQSPSDNFLILGVDVCRPCGDEEFSVTAVVGLWSIDSEKCSHSTRLQAQPARYGDDSSIVQMTDVASMIGQILDSYYTRTNKCLPSAILILLNGTEDEKFKLDETKGLDATLQVFKEIYERFGQTEPSVSCFHIQQQHDFRFRLSFPIKVGDQDDYQMPPGTVIADSNLFGHNAYAFYATLEADSLGTAQPPIARKLKDGISSMTDRDYQKLFLDLCCLSACYTKCTSAPAPIHLAELASKRGKDVALTWREECYSSGDLIEQLNSFFSDLSRHPEYLDTLFFV